MDAETLRKGGASLPPDRRAELGGRLLDAWEKARIWPSMVEHQAILAVDALAPELAERDSLADENALLREELRHQWEMNHAEHCEWDWPHSQGQRCFWPMPAVLLDALGRKDTDGR